ncbi:MAG: hypothetical protein LBD30_03465, partial [Verrucomicrobiales bacterium]|nr:hypothetical protein [Verrucomicrobiales bacterium]
MPEELGVTQVVATSGGMVSSSNTAQDAADDKLIKPSYVVIDLGEVGNVGTPQGLNDSGQVLLGKARSGFVSGQTDFGYKDWGNGPTQWHEENYTIVPAEEAMYLWKNGIITPLSNSTKYVGPLQNGDLYYAVAMEREYSPLACTVRTQNEGKDESGTEKITYNGLCNLIPDDADTEKPNFSSLSVLTDVLGIDGVEQLIKKLEKIERFDDENPQGQPLYVYAGAEVYAVNDQQTFMYRAGTWTPFWRDAISAFSHRIGLTGYANTVLAVGYGQWIEYFYSYPNEDYIHEKEYLDGSGETFGDLWVNENGFYAGIRYQRKKNGELKRWLDCNGRAGTRDARGVYDLNSDKGSQGPYILGANGSQGGVWSADRIS